MSRFNCVIGGVTAGCDDAYSCIRNLTDPVNGAMLDKLCRL